MTEDSREGRDFQARMGRDVNSKHDGGGLVHFQCQLPPWAAGGSGDAGGSDRLMTPQRAMSEKLAAGTLRSIFTGGVPGGRGPPAGAPFSSASETLQLARVIVIREPVARFPMACPLHAVYVRLGPFIPIHDP